jgi:2-polyprenyl-3-methyl-5-hydroxy-6-metoxy-1,4-benzoquinol methylase
MPSAEQLKEFYQGFLYRKPDPSKIEKLTDKKQEELVRYFGRRSPGDAFLDYGAGTGAATRAASRLGWDVYYHDVDHQAHQFVKETQRIDDRRMFSSMEEVPKSHFDMIMCDNVIEHVVDPVKFVSELVCCLKPAGKLVIKTPHAFNTELYFFPNVSVCGYPRKARMYSGNLKSACEIFHYRIWNCDPPRHLFSFTEKSFVKICERLNQANFLVSYYNMPVFEYFMLKRVARKPKVSLAWLGLMSLAIAELLAKPFYLLLRQFNLISPMGISLIIEKGK